MTKDEKFQKARLGIAAQELKENLAMQTVLLHFQRKAEVAREELTEVDPEDVKKIRSLQNDVSKFKELVAALDELIATGRFFETELREEEGEP